MNDSITHQYLTEIQQWIGETQQRINHVIDRRPINYEAAHRLRIALFHLGIAMEAMEYVSLSRYGIQETGALEDDGVLDEDTQREHLRSDGGPRYGYDQTGRVRRVSE